MKEKPKFINQQTKNKWFRQLLRYFNNKYSSDSKERIFKVEDLVNAVKAEGLQEEFINHKD